MSDPSPLHRSVEIEDLTHVTPKDEQRVHDQAEKAKISLHRSEEMEDLAHLTTKDMNKPLPMDQTTHYPTNQ